MKNAAAHYNVMLSSDPSRFTVNLTLNREGPAASMLSTEELLTDGDHPTGILPQAARLMVWFRVRRLNLKHSTNFKETTSHWRLSCTPTRTPMPDSARCFFLKCLDRVRATFAIRGGWLYISNSAKTKNGNSGALAGLLHPSGGGEFSTGYVGIFRRD